MSQKPNPNEEEIRRWLIAKVAEVLETEPRLIDPQLSFDDYGLDSMQAYFVSGDLEVWLGRSLSPSVAWDYPTIEILARHLAKAPISQSFLPHSRSGWPEPGAD